MFYDDLLVKSWFDEIFTKNDDTKVQILKVVFKILCPPLWNMPNVNKLLVLLSLLTFSTPGGGKFERPILGGGHRIFWLLKNSYTLYLDGYNFENMYFWSQVHRSI